MQPAELANFLADLRDILSDTAPSVVEEDRDYYYYSETKTFFHSFPFMVLPNGLSLSRNFSCPFRKLLLNPIAFAIPFILGHPTMELTPVLDQKTVQTRRFNEESLVWTLGTFFQFVNEHVKINGSPADDAKYHHGLQDLADKCLKVVPHPTHLQNDPAHQYLVKDLLREAFVNETYEEVIITSGDIRNYTLIRTLGKGQYGQADLVLGPDGMKYVRKCC